MFITYRGKSCSFIRSLHGKQFGSRHHTSKSAGDAGEHQFGQPFKTEKPQAAKGNLCHFQQCGKWQENWRTYHRGLPHGDRCVMEIFRKRPPWGSACKNGKTCANQKDSPFRDGLFQKPASGTYPRLKASAQKHLVLTSNGEDFYFLIFCKPCLLGRASLYPQTLRGYTVST